MRSRDIKRRTKLASAIYAALWGVCLLILPLSGEVEINWLTAWLPFALFSGYTALLLCQRWAWWVLIAGNAVGAALSVWGPEGLLEPIGVFGPHGFEALPVSCGWFALMTARMCLLYVLPLATLLADSPGGWHKQ